MGSVEKAEQWEKSGIYRTKISITSSLELTEHDGHCKWKNIIKEACHSIKTETIKTQHEYKMVIN